MTPRQHYRFTSLKRKTISFCRVDDSGFISIPVMDIQGLPFAPRTDRAPGSTLACAYPGIFLSVSVGQVPGLRSLGQGAEASPSRSARPSCLQNCRLRLSSHQLCVRGLGRRFCNGDQNNPIPSDTILTFLEDCPSASSLPLSRSLHPALQGRLGQRVSVPSSKYTEQLTFRH